MALGEAQRVRGDSKATVLMLAPGSGLGVAYVDANGLPDSLNGVATGPPISVVTPSASSSFPMRRDSAGASDAKAMFAETKDLIAGWMVIDVDYRLMADNLLDLSHVAFTHRNSIGASSAADADATA